MKIPFFSALLRMTKPAYIIIGTILATLIFLAAMTFSIAGGGGNLNKKLLRMKIGEEISVAELTKDSSDKMYVLKGNLRESDFMRFCVRIKNKPLYEHWNTAFILVDNAQAAAVYIVSPFYGAISTLNMAVEISPGKAYNPKVVKIRRNEADYFVLHESLPGI